jgi:hypothetical protein
MTSVGLAAAGWVPIPSYNPSAEPTALSTSTVPAGRLIVGTSNFNSSTRSYENELVIIEDANTDSPSFTRRNLLNIRFDGNISQIAINPENADEFIVVFSNYNVESLAYTNNNGLSFTAIEGNLAGTETSGDELYGISIRTANILPLDGEILYLVGTSAGLYSTTELNGENTVWTKEAPQTLASLPITWIESRPSDGMILVATHGQGAFWAKANVPTSLAEESLPNEIKLQPNYPNPFNPETTIRFTMSQASDVVLEVFNSNGQKVQSIVQQRLSAGEHTYSFNGSNLNSGVYLLRLQSQGQVMTQKMTLIK